MTQNARFNDDRTAEIYERLLLPRIFRPWGLLLVEKAGLRAGQRVLDVATGPGTLARLAAERAGISGAVYGVDLSANMLAQATAKAPVPGGAPLSFLQAPAESLPFEDAFFDAVVCQQGLQFFADPPACLAEMRRVLKPGGRLALASWAGESGMVFRAAIMAALDAVRTVPSALDPLKWVDENSLRGMLIGAGFKDVQTGIETLNSGFEDLDRTLACVEGTSAGTAVRALDPGQRARFDALLTDALAPYAVGNGYRIPSRAVIGLARA